jgi:hypothetical protein
MVLWRPKQCIHAFFHLFHAMLTAGLILHELLLVEKTIEEGELLIGASDTTIFRLHHLMQLDDSEISSLVFSLDFRFLVAASKNSHSFTPHSPR